MFKNSRKNVGRNLRKPSPHRLVGNAELPYSAVIIKKEGNGIKKCISMFIVCAVVIGLLTECNAAPAATDHTRTITDSHSRQVEIPEKVESAVCVGVGALRYSCYVGTADLIIGVEDYETKPGISRLYNYVNYDKFRDLPVIGTNGVPYTEEIITLSPDVIVMSQSASVEAEELQNKTGIPVVVIPGSDTTLDENAYETIRILGQLYSMETRATELTEYLKSIQKDLDERTKDIPEEEKSTVYVAGVSFKGAHGFEGTESYYGPFELIHARNLANTTGQSGAFDIDLEKVLSWDPDVIFLDFNGLDLIRSDYEKNSAYYHSLKAFQEGNVYSQISFRSYVSNLETALADAYYAACILYPEQFQDIDPVEKAGEIFRTLLGENPYEDLKEAGYEFCSLTIGE